MSDHNNSEVFVYTMNSVGQVGAWSRYEFPFRVDDKTQLGNEFYIRSGDTIHKLVGGITYDEVINELDEVERRAFDAIIQSVYLDGGRPGANKQMIGFDFVGRGPAFVSFGYDQSNMAAFTEEIPTPADTVPGMIIPVPINSPSVMLKIRYPGSIEDDVEPWEFMAMSYYVNDMRPTS